jgi:hypothetical protein
VTSGPLLDLSSSAKCQSASRRCRALACFEAEHVEHKE